MHQVNLSDELYQDIQRRAAVAGFSSVDEYVADVLSHNPVGDTPDLDHLFTPRRIAQIELHSAGQIASNAQPFPFPGEQHLGQCSCRYMGNDAMPQPRAYTPRLRFFDRGRIRLDANLPALRRPRSANRM